MLTPVDVSEVEHGFEAAFSGSWVRLDEEATSKVGKGLSFAWRIEVAPGAIECECVDHLLVALDAAFPFSQPQIWAPRADRSFFWPHVEHGGHLCLPSTPSHLSPRERVSLQVNAAFELLRFDERTRRLEFEREFSAYWDQRASTKSGLPRVMSLLSPGGASRTIAYWFDAAANRIVLGDDANELSEWLANAGANGIPSKFSTTALVRLRRPWIPSEFPENGAQVINQLRDVEATCLSAPGPCPVLFEAATENGSVFAATWLKSASERELKKGFRSLRNTPPCLLLASYRARPIERLKVQRVDGRWIHGRGINRDNPMLHASSAAIIGCGSLGSEVARLLAQTGIGTLILVDPDQLATANLSRHALPLQAVGMNKAVATAGMLRREFPHLRKLVGQAASFETLSEKQRDQLTTVDVIVSCGLPFDGDALIDAWRLSLEKAPVHVCSWVEEFATAGHAVVLNDGASLLQGFEDEQFRYRMTEWPQEIQTLFPEAGCGNYFQPHGALDLSATAGLTARTVLDVLFDRVPHSLRRVWHGDLSEVRRRGGVARDAFASSFVTHEFSW